MSFYVYIIQSSVDLSFYKGFSEQPLIRLAQHNNALSEYTSNKIPLMLIYLEELDTKREALIREKAVKKYSRSQIEQLILSAKNILTEYLKQG